jgi:poly(3-hydroxybutyrate) depolymerase
VRPTCWSTNLVWKLIIIGVLLELPLFWAALYMRRSGGYEKLSVRGRDVWVHTPSKADGQPLPALIVLHGSEDRPLIVADRTGFVELQESAQDPFLAVYPEMATPGGEVWGYDEDVGFFKELVHELDKHFTIAKDEVFICGHSAGGSMALFLQNNLPDVFAGAASVEAGVGHEELWDSQSLGRPTMIVWNTADPELQPWDGYLQYSLGVLRRHDEHRLGPSFASPIAVPRTSNVRHATTWLYGASSKSPPTAVLYWSTSTPTHEWPNGKYIRGCFDGAAVIWEFFRSTRVFHLAESGAPFRFS